MVQAVTEVLSNTSCYASAPCHAFTAVSLVAFSRWGSTADANFGMPSPHKLKGFFHKDNEKRDQEKSNDAQVDAKADADSAHPVGFTELFR